MDIREVLNRPEYDFIKTNPHLGGSMIFATFGGSHAYGTNTPDSDIDVRGCALNSRTDILGRTNFEQVIDNPTDTTIYSFNKLIHLLSDCNPNTIELLGCKPEQYVFFNDIGKMMVEQRDMFLSQKAVHAFGGYATQQLRRLQAALARDRYDQSEKEKQILSSCKSSMTSFNDRYQAFENGAIHLYVDKSQREDLDTEIFLDVNLTHYPLRDYKNIWSDLNTIVKEYGKITQRNKKKDDAHLNKHAMHLIRLYLMCLDSLIGRTPHDWDICTNALPDQMKEVFSDFRVLDTGLKHGTLTVLLENPYEITTYRKDGDYSDHRHPDQVEFVSDLKEDLSRRDFTINAMAANINGEIIDYFDGQYDLLNRRIVCVGDPEQRFEEDALRILRAMRFSARYHFGIERKTANAMLAKKNLLLDIAAERIGSEFMQIMSGRCDWLLENFTEIFEVIIPEITPSIGFVQNNPHHCYDVWEHTVEAICNCHGDTIVKIACLYHDLGKPFCYSEDEHGVGHFYGHAALSAEIAEKSLRNLRLESKLIADVVQLVASHDRVLEVKKNIVRRCLNKFGEIQFMNLILLQEADKSAQRIDFGQRGEQVTRVSRFYRMMQEVKQDQDCFSLKDLTVNGNDLMQIGFPQDKSLGNALNQLLEMVMDDKIENDKEKLLTKAKELLDEKDL